MNKKNPMHVKKQSYKLNQYLAREEKRSQFANILRQRKLAA